MKKVRGLKIGHQAIPKYISIGIIFIHTLLCLNVSVHAKIYIISQSFSKTNGSFQEYVVANNLISELESELREKSGLNEIGFDPDGALVYNTSEKPDTGSQMFRQIICGAVSDESKVFLIGDDSDSRFVQFAVTDAGIYDLETKVMTYLIRIDFADFLKSRKFTPDEVMRTHTPGLTLFHEIDHKVSYDPSDPLPPDGVRPDESSADVRGVIENTNQVRRELSLIERKSTQHKGVPYRGIVENFKNTYEITFVSENGDQKKLRWKPEKK